MVTRNTITMAYNCNVCKVSISEKVYEYSMAHFGKPLCMQHQKAIAPTPKEFFCSICKEKISETVNYYSSMRFGKPLCIHHQKITDWKDVDKEDAGYYCNDCKQKISFKEFKYSVRNFNTPLCRKCQPTTK